MIVGRRLLNVQLDGQDRPVEIKLFMPGGADGAWECRYEIGWPDDPWKSAAWGVDALQAIHLAMQKIAGELCASPYHKLGLLSWPGQGAGYGFPITKNARYLLVGSDKKFDG